MVLQVKRRFVEYVTRMKAQLISRFQDHTRLPISIAQLLGSSTPYELLPNRRSDTAAAAPIVAIADAIPASNGSPRGQAVRPVVTDVACAVRAADRMILTEGQNRSIAQKLLAEFNEAKVDRLMKQLKLMVFIMNHD